LEEELEDEEVTTLSEQEDDSGDDDIEGWVDEVARMSEAEREDVKKSIHPVRVVLVKVSHTAIMYKRLTPVLDSHHLICFSSAPSSFANYLSN
jgi:hypothetical protein